MYTLVASGLRCKSPLLNLDGKGVVELSLWTYMHDLSVVCDVHAVLAATNMIPRTRRGSAARALRCCASTYLCL